MRRIQLIDLTGVYSEWSASAEVAEVPNLYDDEEVDEAPHDLFLPGFAVEIPEPFREEAHDMDLLVLDDEARPEGNAWLTKQFPEKAFLTFLLEHGACFYPEAYEVDYVETAEEVGFEAKDAWAGYKYRNLAFFLKEYDARGYEEAVERYRGI
ncbi:MAG TPA: hypothetical protein VFA47_09085 [Candidatus Manganitrophaceae bacterium]|nr:hypothetical protein [Candidatus Manganitrophaceae bacterium]